MPEYVLRKICHRHGIAYHRLPNGAVLLDGHPYRHAGEAFAVLTLAVTGPREVVCG